MIKKRWEIFSIVSALFVILSLGSTGAVVAGDDAGGSIRKLVIGVQASSVEGEEDAFDSEEDRDGRFNRYQDRPDGFVVKYLRVADRFNEGNSYVDFQAWDPTQGDERYRFRLGVGDKLRVRYRFDATPMVFGNNARSVLGSDHRIADFIQQLMEDPNGDGVPFYGDPAGAGGDNALVQAMARDLLTGSSPFDLTLERRTNELGLTYRKSPEWTFGYQFQKHSTRGQQPLGSGTYQRIRDGYDYWFSVRGIELPASIDYDTSNTSLWSQIGRDGWHGRVDYSYSTFDNDNPFLTYDNPFWFNGVDATSGSRRGLWQEGRVSLPPSNTAWTLALSGAVDLGDNTKLSGSFSTGEHSQDDPFAAITTNPALIGVVDLNGDGAVNGADDPTSVGLLPFSNLNAQADISTLNLRLTSKPLDNFRINASWRSYEHDGGTSNVVLPGRTEYIESHVKTDFKGTTLAYVPHSYQRDTAKLEGVFDATDDLRLIAYWNRQSYDWNQYRDLVGNVSRDAGNRAVEGTDDDTLGLRAFWDGSDKVNVKFHFAQSERDFGGTYTPGYSGENQDIRQYDIAVRDRDLYDLRFDFMPREGVNLGFEVRGWDDTYPNSAYGFLDGSDAGWEVDGSFMVSDTTTVFLYLSGNEAETNMHLRTKCANCPAPAGASWSPPWGVPNFDWFPYYQDEDTSFGSALSFQSEDGRNKFDLEIDYLDATVTQTNRNPGTPTDLIKPGTPSVIVSKAFDFPDQTNTQTTVDAKFMRKLSDRTSVGFRYLFEDWELADFQLQGLDAYGANFLTVDDATRMLLLDAWYGSYDAHLGEVFVKLTF